MDCERFLEPAYYTSQFLVQLSMLQTIFEKNELVAHSHSSLRLPKTE